MNNKVKYNRKEYREEYLNSPEWKTLRDLVFSNPIECQCCKVKPATDLHHMVYRNIVDIKIDDLLPVCRDCHDFIHIAISDGYIPTNSEKINIIKKLTTNILIDDRYEKYASWLRTKHSLDQSEINDIKSAEDSLIRKISGLIKRTIWFNDLESSKFTGFQIEKIREYIRVYKFRKENKLTNKRKRRNKHTKYGRNWHPSM